jgi:hypothetical protein
VSSRDLLVSLKDLESSHDLGKGYAAVFHPVLDGLLALDEDDEAVGRSLEDHLALGDVSASHGACCLLSVLFE